jgi:hypothetical protein
MFRGAKLAVYVFSLIVAAACYLRPSSDDFDRYVYETLIRSSEQPIGEIYKIVKHESSRAEASTVMDSPEHLGELGPLYAIRPLYLELGILLHRAGLQPQRAINVISATSLFLLAILTYFTTRRALYSALLISTPSVVIVGRLGGPDALSSLFVVAGCLAVVKEKLFPGILLLMVSVWIRTDNILVILAVLGWLVWGHQIGKLHASLLALLAIGSVVMINSLSGNYGWRTLLHYSFVGGRYPAEIHSGISLIQYARTFLVNAESLFPQLAPWLLFALATWRLKHSERAFLLPLAIASALHYLLFPSGEARYFTWACLVIGILFIRSLVSTRTQEGAVVVDTRSEGIEDGALALPA